MTPARFQTIEQIFLAALEQEPNQVSAFLDTACDGDAVLRREVEVLLASDQRAGRFIEKSAVGLTTKLLQNQQSESLIGQTIGHYKISESIGTGGMGEVYLATDIVAGRKAALKLLPLRFTDDAERLKRFQQEAHAVVGLNHPNILTVYEIGEDHSIHYIASELIEGETLRQRLTRGRMQLSEAVDIAIQVASALAAAHQAGIVHRDIKPENIMLRPDAYVKVLDFGIAKLAEQELPVTMPRDEALLLVETNLGSILGTVRYMSPEQACGAPVDKRTDIWSLGVVLYEIVTGHVSFTGDTPKEVMSAILEKAPPPLTRYVARAPGDLQQILSKMLRKDRKERYHNAHELLQALKDLRRKLEAKLERAAAPLWLRWARSPAALVLALTIGALALALPFFRQRNLATSLPPDKSIAVLPLQNLSDDKENAFFADGVQDELLSNLSKIKDLKVISRTSVMQYKSGTRRNLKEIAQQLGVSNVVEGSVRRSGDHVRVSVQLIDTRTDRHIWGENYDRKVADSVSLQGELATEIARAVGATLSPREKARVEAKPTNNPAAYDAYLRARAIPVGWGFHAEGDVEAAIRLYQEAVRLDPNFVLAWAYLSIAEVKSHWKGIWKGIDPTQERLAAAKSALDHAIALNPNLPEVHLASGYYEQDDSRALAEFRQAEQGLPNSADVIEVIALAQKAHGNWDESIAELRRAIDLDPRNITAANNLALTYGDMRRFPEALATLDRVLAWAPTDARALLTKAEVLLTTGDLQAAAPLLAKPDIPDVWRATAAMLRRDYAAAVELYSKALAAGGDRLDPGTIVFLADAQRLAADVSAARASYQKAVDDLQGQLENVNTSAFDEAERRGVLGEAYASLGDGAAAIAEGQKAMALCPTSKYPWFGLVFEVRMASIYTRLGDADHAIPILKNLLQLPFGFGVSSARLRLDPNWDSIRNDPRFQELVAETVSLPEKSIAVLRFGNLSRDPDNAYLANGIEEEILTRLARIADLKVISRTSTQHYKSAPENLPEIAKQLGVTHILEGSVQKSGDGVRVNVQLIKAADDSHLWADTFDRKLSDIFSVESDVAKAIADQLQAKLTGQEEQAISVKPTDNPEAYDAYLRGLAFEGRSSSSYGTYSIDLTRKAAGFYERAVRLDPNFALAWARLSRVNAHLCFSAQEESPSAHREAAKRALDNAQKLEPNSPETLLALGYYQYWGLRDYGSAKTTFSHVSKLLPGSSDVPKALGLIGRREGHWDESVAYFEQALTVDPRNVELLIDAASTYTMLRQFPAALKLYDRGLDITPNDPDLMASKAGIYQAQGNLQEAAKLLVEVNAQSLSGSAFATKIIQLTLERNLGEAVRLLQDRQAQFHFDSEFDKTSNQVGLALAQRLAGDTAGAKASAEEARNTLEQLYRDQLDNLALALSLSQAYAAMGEKDLALKTAAHPISLLPRAKDSTRGPMFEENLALIQTMLGENSGAISTLTRLLQTPYGSVIYGQAPITPTLLKLDPIWDPLRADPAFQKLCEADSAPATTVTEKSLAVLPFENLSKDEENAFFAAGVQDEILNDLAKIADLKVISRTSVMQYKSGPERNLREIAKTLGVSHVVEGSVQRVGGRVRLSAQLIDARDDTHIWAEHYDRDVADLFAVQTEIAQQIADQLKVNLSPGEKAAIAERPTADPVAYAYYTEAINSWSDWEGQDKSLNRQVELLEKATQRDPNFALAYCALATTQAELFDVTVDRKHLELAKKAAETAVRVRPDLGETHLALARYYFWAGLFTGDYDRARDELTIALRKLPNNSEALVIGAKIDRHQNRWDSALANLQKANGLDPRNVEVAVWLGETYFEMRRYFEWEQLIKKCAASGTFKAPWIQVNLAKSKLAQGDPAAAQSLLQQVPLDFSPNEIVWDTRFKTALYLWDYDAANSVIAATSAKWADFAFDLAHGSENWAYGQVARARGDNQKAFAAFAAAREKTEAQQGDKPKDAPYFSEVAILDAGLGRKEEAIREAQHAVELGPIAKDSLNGPTWVANLALVYAWTGERDRALEQLEKVATIPGLAPTYGDLRFNPCWDDLRGDKRFDKIVAAAKAANR